MKDNITIEINTAPVEKNRQLVRDGLHKFNVDQVGQEEELSFFAFNSQRKLIGGVIFYVEKSSIFIDNLWVAEETRKKGIGIELLSRAENVGRQRGVHYSTTDTFAFQAVDFYRKAGYQEIGVIPDYIEGHDRYFFRKKL